MLSARPNNPLGMLIRATTKNVYLKALRDGSAFAFPFAVLGSLVLVFINLPLSDSSNFLYQEWYVRVMQLYKYSFFQIFYISQGILAIFITFGIGYSLSKTFNLDSINGGLLCVFAFLLVSAQTDLITLAKDSLSLGISKGGQTQIIDARYLDAKGVFIGILISYFTIHVYKFLSENNLLIKAGNDAPTTIEKGFAIIVPLFIICLILQPISAAIKNIIGHPAPHLLTYILNPLIKPNSSLYEMIFIVFIIQVLWFFGIHGNNIFFPILNIILLENLNYNIYAQSNEMVLPHIIAGNFIDIFVYIGGNGSLLGLSLALSFSKVKYLRKVGLISSFTCIFNINEPLIFGLPMILNPIMLIPFLLMPIFSLSIAYTLTNLGFIAKVTKLVSWSIPSPIAAFIATDGSLSAAALSLSLILLSFIVYLPFLKLYEREILKN